MFSKLLGRLSWLFSMAILCFAQVGCDKFLKASAEKDLSDQIITVSTDEIGCMKKAPKDLRDFFNDQNGREALSPTLSCVQHSLKTFMRLTRGKAPDGYLAKEIQFFFNRNLIGAESVQINDEFLDEIMKLKVVAVGGSLDIVTRLEMEQMIVFLESLEAELGKLQGVVRLASFRASPDDYNPQGLNRVRAAFDSISRFVLKKTKLTSSRYQMGDFTRFLRQLDLFMGESHVLSELLKWMPVAETVKAVFIGENAKLVSDNDWQASTRWVLHSYGTLLRFFYEIKGHELKTPQEWKKLVSWLDEAIGQLENAPAMRERKILEAAALDRLIDQVYDLRIFQTVLSKDLIKSTYRKALVHFIDAPAVRGDPLMIGGLTESHVRVLKKEYNIWKMSQVAINEIYSSEAKQSISSFRRALQKINPQSRISVSALEKEELAKSWDDFRGLMSLQPAVAFDEKGKIHISYRSETNNLPFVGMNMMNSIRTYVRLALRGYGDGRSHLSFKNSLSRERLAALQDDFRDVAEAMNFIDSREKDSASSTFDQGDLLGYHSDGNGWLNAAETYELLSLLISGGRTQLNEIYRDLGARNCLRSGVDIFGRPFVDEACFYKSFREKFMFYFDHAPGAVSFMKSLQSKEWAELYRNLLKISLSVDHVAGQLESSEIRSMTTIMNFIESLMRVYDRNQDGVLSEDEVVAAVPRFQRFISKMSPIGNFMVEDILLYLAYEGHQPSIPQLTLFVAKRHTLGLGDVTKLNLVKLLSILKKDSETNAPVR